MYSTVIKKCCSLFVFFVSFAAQAGTWGTMNFNSGKWGATPDVYTISSVGPGPTHGDLVVNFALSGVAAPETVATSFSVTCGAETEISVGSPATLSGLIPGASYSCSVISKNAAGDSSASAIVSGSSRINSIPVNTASPAITGVAKVGASLSASSGIWTDADSDTLSYSYQWRRGGSNVGINSSAYTLTSADAHAYITVVVTADDGNGGSNSATSAISIVANTAPSLSGTPATSVLVNTDYNFSPVSHDVDGDPLTYAITNKPDWANFDSLSGALTGKPTGIALGDYASIVISVSDGTITTSTPAFSIKVTIDTDGDGIIDSIDSDDDNDGVDDVDDAFPLDDTESIDTDGDGVGDNADDTPYPNAGEINFDSASYVVAENAGSVEITVVRINGEYGELALDYSLMDGTAAATTDYEYQAGTLTFADGETAKQITINIVDDSSYEGRKDFNVTLSNLSKNHLDAGSIGSTDTTTVTIEEDEPVPPAGEIAFESGSEWVIEYSDSFTLNVIRTGGSFGELSVSYSASDISASAGTDFTPVSDVLTFADGETIKAISIELINDDVYEPDETFIVQLSNLIGGGALGASTSTVTISDDDPTPEAGVLEVEHENYKVNESALSLSINVIRTGGDFGEVSVDVSSSNSSATAGEDYESTIQTITFSDGEVLKSATLYITDDSLYEGDETFHINLSNVNGSESGNQSTSVITIVDDDEVPPAGVFQFSGTDYSVDEDAGTVLLTITRTNGSYGSVSVDLNTFDGTAVSDDYFSITETLFFLDGETSRTATLAILDDSIYEGDKNFSVVLSNITGEATLGNPSTTTVTIIEDDETPPSGKLQLSGSTYSVNEGDGSVKIMVLRTDGSHGDVSVDYSTAANNATTNTDYTSADGTLYFGDSEISQSITVSVIEDDVDEDTENFMVTLTDPHNALLGSIQSAVVTIEDNDYNPVVEDLSKNRGGGGSFDASLIALLLMLSVRFRVASHFRKRLHAT